MQTLEYGFITLSKGDGREAPCEAGGEVMMTGAHFWVPGDRNSGAEHAVNLEEFGPSERFGSQPASSRSRFARSWEEFRGFSRFWKDFQRKIKDFQGFWRIPKGSESRGH